MLNAKQDNILDASGSLTVTSDAGEVLSITQTTSNNMFLMFKNLLSKTTGNNWGLGQFTNQAWLTLARREANNTLIQKVRFGTNGDLWIAGTYTSASDSRLKKNIANVDSNLISEVFDKIDVKTYQKINDDSDKCDADDVENAISDLGFDNLVQKDEDGIRSLAYDRMVCLLWAQVKILKEEIELLKQDQALHQA